MVHPSDRRGFTLIELLIVVVIIGLLAAIAVPKYNNSRNRAFSSTMKSDLRHLITKQEVFHGDSLFYASDMSPWRDLPSADVTITVNAADGRGWGATAWHAALPSEQCGVYFGSAAASSGSPATEAGAPMCTF
jgi:prepilin-type N-terminal cleavage/methylation domain-containing protein